MSCTQSKTESNKNAQNQENSTDTHKGNNGEFTWQTEQFADLRILRYQVPGWDKLSLRQKKLAYYLQQAGLSGRDIFTDQLFKYNLEIRDAIDQVVKNYAGEKGETWQKFMVYAKRFWFSNGIHHHYSHAKFKPDISKEEFRQLLEQSKASLRDEALDAIFSDSYAKGVSKDADKDLVQASAVNFYGMEVTQSEAEEFYNNKINPEDETPVSLGLNSKLVKENGNLKDEVWKVNGRYSAAIKEIIKWLQKAHGVAENDQQAKALALLIEYYKSGDLELWDEYNVAWVKDTGSAVDYINGFIEVYHDPLGMKATYESVVQIKDLDASEKMAVISDNIQYFEDNSPIMDKHKKTDVVGVSYKMINVVGEAGATAPSSPIGINLPNSSWIREKHGSKSVSLANIEGAYENAKGKGFLEEFTFTTQELERAKKYATLSGKMHTALHEVVGHASGKINDGVNPTKALKNYYSTLEEARADLVALYYILDTKLMELNLIDTLAVGYAEYDNYIRNGLMLQLRRLNPGEVIEEDHMRNRQLVASWVYKKGKSENVIEKKVLEGKTYFVINDYHRLRELFGDLLREIQRIKSEGDYTAGKNLVETYGVQVNEKLHKEVLKRTEKLNIAPYSGFIQPKLVPETKGDSITDIAIKYPDDFTQQMLEFNSKYNYLK